MIADLKNSHSEYKLLIDEPPLQVLPSLAKAIGLNQAIFVQQLHYLLRISDNVTDGHTWVYNTIDQWHGHFPFWDQRTIQRIIADLEEKKIIISGCYNRLKIDRTKWYRINYFSLRQLVVMEKTDCRKGRRQDVVMHDDKKPQALPKTTPKNTTKNNTSHKLPPDPMFVDVERGAAFIKQHCLTGTLVHEADPIVLAKVARRRRLTPKQVEYEIDLTNIHYRLSKRPIDDATGLLVSRLCDGEIKVPEKYIPRAQREADLERKRQEAKRKKAEKDNYEEDENKALKDAEDKLAAMPQEEQNRIFSEAKKTLSEAFLRRSQKAVMSAAIKLVMDSSTRASP